MIIKNEQLINNVHDYDVILFGMGINNSMNKGISYEIALNFPKVKISEDATGYGDTRKYGKTHETKVSDNLSFCACYCYNIGLKKKNNGVYIDYEALEDCLTTVHEIYKGKKIASPIIGQDEFDGNGEKNKIIEIYKRVFGDYTNLTLYDFVQCDFRKERYKEAVAIRKQYTDGIITKEEFKHLKKINEWKRLNGIFKNMPDEFEYKPRRKTQSRIVVSRKKVNK